MTDRLSALIALGWLPGVGPATLRKAAVHGDLDHMSTEDLGAIDARIARALAEPGAWDAALRAADADREQALKAGVRLFIHGDPSFPSILARASEVPFFLYVKGTLQERNTLAVIGTRAPTPRGAVVANKIATHFAASGVSIVGGLAFGIDATAHVAALDAGGHTVAVLGHGLQTIYPREHAALAGRILDQGGALVSEYPFGTPLVPARLIERDRIQAGLSQAVIMVQSRSDGGSMHAAKAALRNGRRLYVPAPLDADLASDNPAIEVPRMLTQASGEEICALFRCDEEKLAEIQMISGREDYLRVTQYLQGSALSAATPILQTQPQGTAFMPDSPASPPDPVWINPGPTMALQTESQLPELEIKISLLRAQAQQPQDLDALAEIHRFHDEITGLEKIQDEMHRGNRAYTLARKHIVQYYGFDSTSHEQDMLQVILDGMDASPVYRRTIAEEATSDLEFALLAAAVVRDRAIVGKELGQDVDMQPTDPEPAPEYDFQF